MNARTIAILGLISLLVIALVVLAIGQVITPAASAASPGELGTLTGPGIVHRDTSKLPPLVNSQMVIMQGTKDSDGVCHYSIDFSAKNGDKRPQMAREVARDPVTCRFQIERGNPTVLPTDPAGGASRSSETSTR